MKRHFPRLLFIVLAIVLVAVVASCKAEPDIVRGTVFQDLDGDGVRDPNEDGIPWIVVSNGFTVSVTDQGGEYQLPREGYFVFITTPSDYTPTTPWYHRLNEGEGSFGLHVAPQKDVEEFAFVQITDIHLDTREEHVALFEQAIDEINEVAPAFVVATGDLVWKADEATISEAREWFDTYSLLIQDLQMPIYNAVGNHDVVGIGYEHLAPSEPGYGKEMYRTYFGPTYYSFDWGSYHCIILDPNESVDGQQVFSISESQLEWLQEDLKHSQEKPLLLFFHEPTTSWENRSEVFSILGEREILMFCGHWHFNVLMDSYGIPEQVTGALCGEWWSGPNLDGKPFGYQLVVVEPEGVSVLYKGISQKRTINMIAPSTIASGETILRAQIYSGYGRIRQTHYSVDGGQAVPIQLETGLLWDTATALLNATELEAGYHVIAIEAADEEGAFSQEFQINVSEDEVVPVHELLSNFEGYRGHYATVTGQVTLAAIGPPFAGRGSGVIVITDETGSIVTVAVECISPPLPELAQGDTVRVRGLAIQQGTESLGTLQQYVEFLPEGLVVTDEAGRQMVRLIALVSGADIQKLDR